MLRNYDKDLTSTILLDPKVLQVLFRPPTHKYSPHTLKELESIYSISLSTIPLTPKLNMVHSRRGFSNQRRQSTTNSEENRRSTIRQQRRSQNVYKCKLCNKFHALKVCRKFLKMSPKERNIWVLREVYCVNCLARSHRFRDCRSRNMCKKCGRPHNTLLHPNYAERKSRTTNNNGSENREVDHNNNNNNASSNSSTQQAPNQKILSEAIRALATVLCSAPK
ncbi:uncharacterized protein LOC142219877 [Haematobia irritans]|uniref:uncharacterized protein LOC142219877 n=1 Tax=Haematobia irritans TaxID=7368 RepID=UPI003F4F7319